MFLFGIIIIIAGIGIVIGNYHDKERFMSRDYTENDIKNYQKTLAVGCAIVLFGFIALFA